MLEMNMLDWLDEDQAGELGRDFARILLGAIPSVVTVVKTASRSCWRVRLRYRQQRFAVLVSQRAVNRVEISLHIEEE